MSRATVAERALIVLLSLGHSPARAAGQAIEAADKLAALLAGGPASGVTRRLEGAVGAILAGDDRHAAALLAEVRRVAAPADIRARRVVAALRDLLTGVDETTLTL